MTQITEADIPTDPKAFWAWVDLKSPYWPTSLVIKAKRVLCSMDTMDQTAWGQSYALRKAAKADWSAFTTALAEWRAK